MKPSKERNSSIELLRIIAEIGVVILHLNNGSIGGGFSSVKHGSFNEHFLFFTECLFICAVNLFIIISAYFLYDTNKRRLSKIIEFLIQASVFGLFFYLVPVLLRREKIKIIKLIISAFPSRYYVILYSVLFIISPYINVLLNKLAKKQTQILIMILFCIFSVWSFGVDCVERFGIPKSVSPVSMEGSQSGYTIVNFVLLYFLGAYIKRYGLELTKKKLYLLTAITFFLEYFLSVFYECGFNYNNPLVILLAVFVFSICSSYSFHNVIINNLSKASFTCFLFHPFFVIKLRDVTETIVNKSIFVLIGYYFLISVGLFLLSYSVYFIYDHCFLKMVHPLIKKIDKYDIYKLDND